MEEIIEEKNITKYSEFNLKQLKYDYRDFWLHFLFFIIPFAGTFCIFHFVDSKSKWIGFGFILIMWALYGFYLITRPLILRILIPIIMFFLRVIILLLKLLQYLFVGLAEYLEKKLH